MTMQTATWQGEAACARLADVGRACDEAVFLLRAVAAETRWESPAADAFASRLWERIGEAAAIGEFARQLASAARAAQGAAP